MGMNVMHQNGMTHGNISPKYIGLDNRTNNYILMDRFDREKPVLKLL